MLIADANTPCINYISQPVFIEIFCVETEHASKWQGAKILSETTV